MSPRNRLPDPSRLLFGSQNIVIWLVAIVGVSLSFTAMLLMQHQLEAHRMLDFEWVAHNRIRAVSYGIDNSMQALTTIGDHVSASGGVDGKGFRMFAESLQERHQGIQSIMWAVPVKAEDRAAFEAGVAGKGGYRLLESGGQLEPAPAGQRAEYFPVLHMIPDRSRGISRGFDLGSIPGFTETLLRARDQGKISVSGRISYPAPGDTVEYGFMVASPVFGRDAGLESVEQRRQNLSGFVVGFIQLTSLTNAAISLLQPRGVEMLILDETASADERFLHFYASRLAPGDVGPENFQDWMDDPKEPRSEEDVRVADRQLAIIGGRTDKFRSAEAFQKGPWMVLGAGLLFTIMLSFYLARVREISRQRSAMERQLVEREELFRQMTETVDEGFWATVVNGRELLYLCPAYG